MQNFSGRSLGRYHLIEQLGEGGMATVYRGFDTTLECDVAVKFLRTDRVPPESAPIILKRFETEARKTARLTHPNIVPVTDYGEFEGIPYLVMKYLPGGTVKQLTGKPVPWKTAIDLLLPIAEALDYAHENGIIHRDVKPANILITDSGVPMLSDFGIAKVIETLEETQDHLTVTGVGIGTPEYMSPEQASGKKVDGRTDIYALGVVLYELITGRKPFTADTPLAVIIKQTNDPLPRPGQYISDLPEKVEQLLYKALAKNPEDRFEKMRGLILKLRELQLSVFEPDPGAHRKEDTQKPAAGFSIKKWLWLIGVIALVVLFILIKKPRAASQVITTPAGTAVATKVDDPGTTAQTGSRATLFSDDFETASFDGGHDTGKWNCGTPDCGPQSIKQENGVLELHNSSGRAGTAHSLDARGTWKTGQIGSVAVDVLIAGFSGEPSSEIILQLNVPDAGWYTSCNAGADTDGAYLICRARKDGSDVYTTQVSRLLMDQWYALRIVINPQTTGLSYYLNDKSIGEYLSPEADLIAGSNAGISIAAYSNGVNEFTGSVDNFSVLAAGEENNSTIDPGQVDGVALVVEDFNDNQINMIGYSAQGDVSLVETASGDSALQINNLYDRDYAGFSIGDNTWQDFTVNLRLKFTGINEQFLIQLRSGLEKYDMFTIDTGYVQFYLADPDWTLLQTKVVSVTADVWHQVRIDVIGDTIRLYIDDALWINGKTSTQKGDVAIFGSGEGALLIDDLVITENPDAPGTTETDSGPGDSVEYSDYTRLSLYDDFSNPAYEGFYDNSKWTYGMSAESEGKQSQGRFVITSQATNPDVAGGELALSRVATVDVTNAISAKMLIKEMEGVGFRLVQKINPQIGSYWHYGCFLEGRPDGMVYYCEVVDFRVDEEERVHTSAIVDMQWNREYESTITIDPETMTFRVFLDGKLFDVFVPEDAALLKRSDLVYVLDLYLDSSSSGEGYYDDVYLGEPIDA